MFNIHSYFIYVLQSSVIFISHGIIIYKYVSLYYIYYYNIKMIDIDICEQMVTLLFKSSQYIIVHFIRRLHLWICHKCPFLTNWFYTNLCVLFDKHLTFNHIYNYQLHFDLAFLEENGEHRMGRRVLRSTLKGLFQI